TPAVSVTWTEIRSPVAKPTALTLSAQDVPVPRMVQATRVLLPFFRIVNVTELPEPGAVTTVAWSSCTVPLAGIASWLSASLLAQLAPNMPRYSVAGPAAVAQLSPPPITLRLTAPA